MTSQIPVEELLAAAYADGVLDAQGLAEAIWLVEHLYPDLVGETPERPEVAADAHAAAAADQQPEPATPSRPPAALPDPTPRIEFTRVRTTARGPRIHRQVTRHIPSAQAEPFARGLRSLRQTVHAAGPDVLDENATVHSSGEAGTLLPRFQPRTERWLELAVVVDTSVSMWLWQPTLADIIRSIRTQSIFRDIRIWTVDGDSTVARLRTGSSAADPQTDRNPAELSDPTGRRLVLVITDGVGRLWRTDDMAEAVLQWAVVGPLAFINVLPERLWHRTELPPVRTRTMPGQRGLIDLHPTSSAHRLFTASQRLVAVIGLDSVPIERWASVLSGARGGWQPMTAIALPHPPSDDPLESNAESSPSADLVKRFRVTSAPAAFELATYLAAAPLTVPLMRLVQHHLVPASGPAELAEIFLSGLLVTVSGSREDGPDQIVYDFVDDGPAGSVREELLANLPRRKAFEVLTLLSDISASEADVFGGSLDFRTLLVDGQTSAPPESWPFAQVAVSVLASLGGDYQTLADEIGDTYVETLEPQVPPALLMAQAVQSVVPDAFEGVGRIGDCTLEVFDMNSNPRMRWYASEGLVNERRLRRGEMDQLLSAVATRYGIGLPELSTLGAEIYRWLDGGSERWLASAVEGQQPILLYVNAPSTVRDIPWELIHDGGYLAVHPSSPISPVRLASARRGPIHDPANRPLRLLFMASSPADVMPVLNFEYEEAVIMDAAAGRVEVVVEESGSLEGLQSTLNWFGPDYFDVVHLSSHAALTSEGPRLLLEDAEGRVAPCSAAQVAHAIQNQWPGMLFLSGCSTGRVPNAGSADSMAEALVAAGAPAVLGWALPVGDQSASNLAATLYGHLSTGASLDEALARSRRHLFEADSPFWHLLRLYTDATPLAGLVMQPGAMGRIPLRARPVDESFLDAARQIKVVSRRGFVGRRRELQNLLTALRPHDATRGPQIALILGMGGLGKSSVAARLLERMSTTHPLHAVWIGHIDTRQIVGITARLNLTDPIQETQINEILSGRGSLEDRLRFLLEGLLIDAPCVFVFDDFDDGNLVPDGRGGWVCTPDSLDVVRAFAGAIRLSGSSSRMIITSRFDFGLPHEIGVHRLPISQLQEADLQKMLAALPNLGPLSPVDPTLVGRAVDAAAGNPRLLGRLDQILATSDAGEAVSAIENTETGFRDDLLLSTLLAQQSSRVRNALALAAVYEIAVPVEAILALGPRSDLAPDIKAALSVGLIQAGLHRTANEQRYLVSSLVRPLLPQLDPETRNQAQVNGARFLYKRWAADGSTTETEALEIFRRAEAGAVDDVVREVGDRLIDTWATTSRFPEALQLAERSLACQVSPGTVIRRGQLRYATGDLSRALDDYEQALYMSQQTGERLREASTLNNIGLVHDARGDRHTALARYHQALSISRELGDRAGEANILDNIGTVHLHRGDIESAARYYEAILPIRRQVGDRAGEATSLNNMGTVYQARGDTEKALTHYEQALSIQHEIGDRAGEATSLNNIGALHQARGDDGTALKYFDQALAIRQRIGDRRGEGETRRNIARICRNQGRLTEAVEHLERAVALCQATQHPALETYRDLLRQARAELFRPAQDPPSSE